jgi:hypothetical protein
LLRKNEFLKHPKTFTYIDVAQNHKTLELQQNSLCFTFCQIPVVYKIAATKGSVVNFENGDTLQIQSLTLDEKTSQMIFGRSGEVKHIEVHVLENDLK